MNRRQKNRQSILTKRSNDQKLIEAFLSINQGKKTEMKKIEKNEIPTKNSDEISKETISVEEKKSLGKAEIDFIQSQNELKLINNGIFFEEDNKKLLEEVKQSNPELYQKLSVDEELIFPIMIDTNLGVIVGTGASSIFINYLFF